RVYRQFGGDQIRVARLIGLGVQAFRDGDFQSDAGRSTRPNRAFNDRRDVGFRAAQLGRCVRRTKETKNTKGTKDIKQTKDMRVNAHSVSLVSLVSFV